MKSKQVFCEGCRVHYIRDNVYIFLVPSAICISSFVIIIQDKLCFHTIEIPPNHKLRQAKAANPVLAGYPQHYLSSKAHVVDSMKPATNACISLDQKLETGSRFTRIRSSTSVITY